MKCHNKNCKEKEVRKYYPSGLTTFDKDYEIINSCSLHKPMGWRRLE